MSDKLITLQEAANLLRVSRHTVQAWVSPSSPNHRPEFAALARHAGRRTLFTESEVLAWLDQRRGALYADSPAARTAYWREKFVAGRGLMRGVIKPPEQPGQAMPPAFNSGMLGIDLGPLLTWLTDGAGAAEIFSLTGRAEGLVLSVPLVHWLLRRETRAAARFAALRDFLIEQNIFELAPFNEAALHRSLTLPLTNSLAVQNYSCCLEFGASVLLTADQNLLRVPGLPVCGY